MDEKALAKAISDLIAAAASDGKGRSPSVSSKKKSRKPRAPSAYNKEFSKQMKALKKKHPRTPATKLMKRAHTATKKARRGKR
jgi:hypothetical protein